MEEIFKCSNIEHHDIDSERELTLPSMKHMELKNLPRLVNMISQGFNFKLHTGEFCRVEVHDCPKLMPIKRATIDWTKEGLVRKYVLKDSQLNNNEALNHPLSVLNPRELDSQAPRVEHRWRVMGDYEQEETNNSEQQMLGGLVPTQVLSFQYLCSLKVTHSKKLKFLFSMSTFVHNSLPKLTSLTLADCEELEEIIAENKEHQIMSNVQVCFPELRQLVVERCNKLKRLFSMSMTISLPQLDSLWISEANQLEAIFGHGSEKDASYGETTVLSSLRMIELRNLPNLISVCEGSEFQGQLSNINIHNCPRFVDSSLGRALQQLAIISVLTEDSNVQTSSNAEKQLPVNEEKGMMLISSAEYLSLEDSNDLIYVWEGPSFFMFQNLKQLCLSGCRKLKCIFSSTMIRSLPCLEYLSIEECEEMEEIMSSEEEHHHFPNSFCFPQLHTLVVFRCRKLKWLFPSLTSSQPLPQLKYLRIKECSQLKGLCSCKLEIQEEGFYNNILPELIDLHVKDCPIFSKITLSALQSQAATKRRYRFWW
ncbi:uncharacterized protein LOC114744494 isoform X2 [Neltuma alba]|uniref:uncharacterized protein LOC114744494 isoform X2 n=1 Tax=Neltuma alba TaxID=207710 RepID=UPI0010A4BA11|nr:uncharacterized protein LOC114744494 isoform X2 [Prosopis alba]